MLLLHHVMCLFGTNFHYYSIVFFFPFLFNALFLRCDHFFSPMPQLLILLLAPPEPFSLSHVSLLLLLSPRFSCLLLLSSCFFLSRFLRSFLLLSRLCLFLSFRLFFSLFFCLLFFFFLILRVSSFSSSFSGSGVAWVCEPPAPMLGAIRPIVFVFPLSSSRIVFLCVRILFLCLQARLFLCLSLGRGQ